MIRDIIEEKLREAYAPDGLEVIDESHLHVGHSGARPEGETHFRVKMVAAAFDGMSRLERQRRVMAILREELDGPVHALALKLHSPTETGN